MKRRDKGLISLMIIALFILPILVYAEKQMIEVVVENASIRSKPDVDSEIIKSEPLGSVFEVERKVGKWYEIKVLSRLGILIDGYIHEKYVKVIKEEVKAKKGIGFFLEVQGVYFQPSDQVFKDIYGSGMYYGGEIGINIWKGIGIWAGGQYINKKGKLTFTQEETEIKIMPFYGGIKFRLPDAKISPYISLGVGYFKYKETSPIGTVEKGNIGYIGQLGCLFKILGPLVIDIKGSYSYCKIKPEEIEANLGGLQGVVGIGVDFNP